MSEILQNRRDLLKQMAVMTASCSLPAFSLQASETAASQSKIRIGQIGVEHGHANKIRAYRESSDYEVIGIAEPNPEARRKAEQQSAFQGLNWMSVEELLAAPGLQAVLIETHIRDLLKCAEMAVNAGMHVHIDKPAGSSLPHFERIIEKANAKQLMVQLGYMYRYNPGFLLLEQFLKDGWLGDIFQIDAVMSKVIPPNERLQLAEYSGGTMFELGCHLIDLVIRLMGEPESIHSTLQHSYSIADGLNDNCLSVFTWPRANATIRSAGQEVEGFRRRQLIVCGTEGTFEIQPLDNPRVVVSFSQQRGKYSRGTHTIEFPKFSRYVADAADMAQVIRGEKKSDYSYEHELLVQKVVLQASQMPTT